MKPRLLPRIRSWRAYGRMFTKRRVWTRAIRFVLKKHGLPLGRIASTYPGTCAVFALRSDRPRANLLIKFLPQICRRDWLAEAAALDLVGRRTSIRVPEIVARGILRDRSDWPYMVLKPVQGRPLREVWRRIPRADRLSIMAQVGLIVRNLHGIRLRRSLPGRPGSWSRRIGMLVSQALASYRKAGIFSSEMERELAEILPRLTRPVNRFRPVLVHGDFNEDHVIVRRIAGRWRVVGVIDFGDVELGDPAYEWLPLWFGLMRRDPAFLRAFMRRYEPGMRLTAKWRDRTAAFILAHRFGPPTVIGMMKEQEVQGSHRTWGELRDWLWPPLAERGSGSRR